MGGLRLLPGFPGDDEGGQTETEWLRCTARTRRDIRNQAGHILDRKSVV